MQAVLYLVAIILLVVAAVMKFASRYVPGLCTLAAAIALAGFAWSELTSIGD